MGALTSLLAEAAPLRARRAAIALLAALPIASCAGLFVARQLPQMNEEQAIAWGEYMAGQITAIARVAIEAGDMSLDGLWLVQEAFENLGLGQAPASTSQLVKLGPYGTAALELSLNDLHYRLSLQGGFTSDGGLVNNAKIACMQISARLKKLHQELRNEAGNA